MVYFLTADFFTRAVDGHAWSTYKDESCTHTEGAPDSPWLVVDLEDDYIINYVKIKNRGDCCGK